MRNALTNIFEGFREENPERILKGLAYVATGTLVLGTVAFEPIDWAVSSNEVRPALAEGRYQDVLYRRLLFQHYRLLVLNLGKAWNP